MQLTKVRTGLTLCSTNGISFVFRDHRKLLVGDFRGRIYSWSVTDAAGMNSFNSCEKLKSSIL